MKYIIWVFILFSLAGCRSDIVDVSQLNSVDQILFAIAAADEGISVTTHGQPWDWTVEYDWNTDFVSYVTYKNLHNNIYCNMRINPNKLSTCETKNTNRHFATTSKFILKYCLEINNNQNPKNEISSNPPC